MAHQPNDSVALSTSFSGNIQGSSATLYTGEYQVTQAANIGNTPGVTPGPYRRLRDEPWAATRRTVSGSCTPGTCPSSKQPGFFPWPELTTFFEWDEGDPSVENDAGVGV